MTFLTQRHLHIEYLKIKFSVAHIAEVGEDFWLAESLSGPNLLAEGFSEENAENNIKAVVLRDLAANSFAIPNIIEFVRIKDQ